MSVGITGGLGNDDLDGGAGNDLFVFANFTGQDTVQDFTAGAGTEDVLDVSDFGFADLAQLLAASDDQGGTADVVIDLDNNDSVTLVGVRIAHLHEDDFLL
jgi:Ca2+-binding RTX toxin-like protein